MLFLRFTADRKAEVIEASPGACNGRVCRNIYPLASVLARGYAPVRFRGLANETVVNVSFPDVAAEEGRLPRPNRKRRSAPDDTICHRNAAIERRSRHAGGRPCAPLSDTAAACAGWRAKMTSVSG